MKQYIDKSAVVAEIARLQSITMDEDGNFYTAKAQAEYNVLCMLDSFLDTLEVKEVDLGKEYTEEIYSHLDSIKDTADRMTSGNFMHNKAAIKFSANTITKVLELIGLKAQKGG